MKKLLFAFLFSAFAASAWAQTPPPVLTYCGSLTAPTVCSGSGGGGGGGAVTAAAGSYVDGALVTLGSTSDTAYAGSGNASDTAILKGIYNGIAAPLPAGTNNIGVVSVVGQRPFTATVTITRPANTTAYTAGQVLSSATTGLTALPTFALGIGNSQKLVINNVSVFSNNGSASTKGQFAVYLFNTASPSGGGFNDASTFAPTAAALSTNGNDLVGVVPSSFPFVGTAAYGYILTNDTRQATTDSSGNLYLAVVLANAYTPASAETITVTISGLY